VSYLGNQEPGSNVEIQSFCQNQGSKFHVFAKLDCGSSLTASPLFQFLTKTLTGGILGDGLKWNFHKFLCDSEGRPLKRYGPLANPLSIEPDIKKLLETDPLL